jgi:hypothetical protein
MAKHCSKSKWYDDACGSDGHGEARIATDNCSIYLESDDKKEEAQPDVRDEREIGY